MSKNVQAGGWPNWMQIPDTPGPGRYDPLTPNTQIPISIIGKNNSAHDNETPGPGPAGYDSRIGNSASGHKWHPATSKPSSKKESVTNPNLTNTSASLRTPKSHRLDANNYENPNSLPQVHQKKKLVFPKSHTEQQSENSRVTWPSPEMIDNNPVSIEGEGITINGSETDAVPYGVLHGGDVNYSPGYGNTIMHHNNEVKDRNTPFQQNQEINVQHTENDPQRPSIFLSVPLNQSPFAWLTDGKLSIFGCIFATCVFLFGIVHLCLWPKGLCIFSGIWQMLWGLLILLTEGMLLPKITVFNRLEIIYPMTRLINNRSYWVKTVLYTLIGIISISVCAKWTSGVAGGMLIILSFMYGMKQIDENYRNREMEFNRTHRRPDAHVPVWTITE